MRISASRLAAVLAARLDPVVPLPFRVRAEGTDLRVDHPTGWGLRMPLDWIEKEGEDREAAELAELIGGNALSSVQDAISESSAEPWPALAPRVMALPGTRRDASHIYLWYGLSEHRPVVAVEPIPLASVVYPE
jgi:hypothetical protein